MTISIVQSHQTSGSGTHLVVALSSNTTAGNTLLAGVAMPVGASVSSVTDNISGRWIQVAYSYNVNGNGGSEIWMSRGIRSGAASVTVNFTSSAASVGTNVSEWTGIAYGSPVDQWSQSIGTSASPSAVTVKPRATGDLFFAVCAAGASVSHPGGSYTVLSTGWNDQSIGYYVESGTTGSAASWTSVASRGWAVAEACFQAGANGSNPLLQFPETLVQISTGSNYLAPLNNGGVWTDISGYVQDMTLGPIGRAHLLDRVQAAPASIDVDNRNGTFNPWNNTSSGFLYNGGSGLMPMNPVKVTAAWNGVTYPVYYGYLQSVTPVIKDVLNVNATLNCIDIFQLLSLKYLSNDNYAQQVMADGGANLKAYYRLGDPPGQWSCEDSSGNNYTGSLRGNAPALGATPVFLYDASTALDCSGGTNLPGGGFNTTDYTTESPTVHNPLSTATSWTLECWFKSTATTIPGSIVSGTFIATPSLSSTELTDIASGTIDGIVIGGPLSGSGIPTGTVVASVASGNVYMSTNGTASVATTVTANFYSPNAVLFEISESSTGAELQLGSFQLTTTPGPGVVAGNIVNYPNQFAFVNNNNTIYPLSVPSPINPLDGKWHHLGCTYTSPNVTVYIDGNPNGVCDLGLADLTNIHFGMPSGNGYQAGSVCTINAQPFPGTISDVAMYNTTLTQTQFQNHTAIGNWFQSVELGAINPTSASIAASARLNKVLYVSGLPIGILYVPDKFLTEVYAETSSVTTTSALNYIQTQTETEPGLIFQGPNGIIFAYNRQYQYLNATSTSPQAVFGDNTSTTHFYDGTQLQVVQDDLDVFNDIQVQSGIPSTSSTAKLSQSGQLQEWGPTQSTAMATSAATYGARTLQGLTSLQFEYDSDALAVAQNYGAWYANPLARVQQLPLSSTANGGANLSHMLGRWLYDQITVQYQGQSAGPQFSQDSLIESITHNVSIQAGMEWRTTWALSPYEILMDPIFLGVWTFGSTGQLTL